MLIIELPPNPENGKGTWVALQRYLSVQEYIESIHAIEVDLEQGIKDYDDYIKLLTEEWNELVGVASVHGWKSSRYEQGVELRKKIESFKEGLGLHKGD